MKTIRLIAGLLVMTAGLLNAQPANLPWWVADGGGGKSAGTGMNLFSSVGQSAIGAMASVSMNLEGGYIPGVRNLSGTTAEFSQSAGAGWNMISVPLIVSDFQKTTLYPGAASNAFNYNNGYFPQTVLQNGTGYWLQYASISPVAMTGTTFQQETLIVAQGWNLIGTPSYLVLKTDVAAIGTTINSNIFGYNGATYILADTLQPGEAYWVQVSTAGRLVVNAGLLLLAAPDPRMVVANADQRLQKGVSLLSPEQLKAVEGFHRMHIRDAGGMERTLFFSGKEDLDLTGYALPPVAPDGNLDVRFVSQRLVEMIKAGKQSGEFPIQVAGGKYPLKISWDVPSGKMNAALVVRSSEGTQKRYPLAGSSSIVIPDEEAIQGLKLVLTPEATKELPKEFALYQNYPNPLNPTTQIQFDVPKSSHVSLKVYNLLGEEVATLVDEEREAGAYSVEFDASRFASGVYFYRFQSGEISFTKKLMLVR